MTGPTPDQVLKQLDYVMAELADKWGLYLWRDGPDGDNAGSWRFKYTTGSITGPPCAPTVAQAVWVAVAFLASRQEEVHDKAHREATAASERLASLRQLQSMTPENLEAALNATAYTEGSIRDAVAKLVRCYPENVTVETPADCPGHVVVTTPRPPANPMQVAEAVSGWLRNNLPAAVSFTHVWADTVEPL